jgi:cadmium resistance protein CadD (predicted permease)
VQLPHSLSVCEQIVWDEGLLCSSLLSSAQPQVLLWWQVPVERVDGSVSVLSIATITLANGADNVGVYVPFFVAHRADLQLVLVVYGLLVLVWCAVGKWFGRHALALKALAGWGHWIVPFVLIGLGGYILLCG